MVIKLHAAEGQFRLKEGFDVNESRVQFTRQDTDALTDRSPVGQFTVWPIRRKLGVADSQSKSLDLFKTLTDAASMCFECTSQRQLGFICSS